MHKFFQFSVGYLLAFSFLGGPVFAAEGESMQDRFDARLEILGYGTDASGTRFSYGVLPSQPDRVYKCPQGGRCYVTELAQVPSEVRMALTQFRSGEESRIVREERGASAVANVSRVDQVRACSDHNLSQRERHAVGKTIMDVLHSNEEFRGLFNDALEQTRLPVTVRNRLRGLRTLPEDFAHETEDVSVEQMSRVVGQFYSVMQGRECASNSPSDQKCRDLQKLLHDSRSTFQCLSGVQEIEATLGGSATAHLQPETPENPAQTDSRWRITIRDILNIHGPCGSRGRYSSPPRAW